MRSKRLDYVVTTKIKPTLVSGIVTMCTFLWPINSVTGARCSGKLKTWCFVCSHVRWLFLHVTLYVLSQPTCSLKKKNLNRYLYIIVYQVTLLSILKFYYSISSTLYVAFIQMLDDLHCWYYVNYYMYCCKEEICAFCMKFDFYVSVHVCITKVVVKRVRDRWFFFSLYIKHCA